MKGSTTILTVTSRGKITLTKDLLDHAGVSPGEHIDVTLAPDGKLKLKAVRQKVARHDAVTTRDK